MESSSSSGRGFHVKGDNLLEWKTFRLNNPLKNGDVVGCGWVRGEEGVKGTIYFTLNGDRLPHEFQETPAEMLPFLHIQKKVKMAIITARIVMYYPTTVVIY